MTRFGPGATSGSDDVERVEERCCRRFIAGDLARLRRARTGKAEARQEAQEVDVS